MPPPIPFLSEHHHWPLFLSIRPNPTSISAPQHCRTSPTPPVTTGASPTVGTPKLPPPFSSPLGELHPCHLFLPSWTSPYPPLSSPSAGLVGARRWQPLTSTAVERCRAALLPLPHLCATVLGKPPPHLLVRLLPLLTVMLSPKTSPHLGHFSPVSVAPPRCHARGHRVVTTGGPRVAPRLVARPLGLWLGRAHMPTQP
jgi:hypothetical protein